MGLLTATRRRGFAVALTIALTGATVAAPAAGAPPENDSIGGFRSVTSVPFYAAQDTLQATPDPTDGDCVAGDSVWYRYRPGTTGAARVATVGSDFDTLLAVFSGPRSARSLVACDDDGPGAQSAVAVTFEAGVTYWIAISTCCVPEDDAGGRAVLRVYRPRAGWTDVSLGGVQSGAVSGRLLVSGAVACGTPGTVELGVAASQRVGARVARGSAFAFVSECDNRRRTWRVRLDSDTGDAFRPGRVAVEVSAAGFDGFRLTTDAAEATLPVTSDPDGRTRH